MTRQFVGFLVAGGCAAAVNLLSRYVLNIVTSFEVAVVGAYLLGMLTAYVLTKRFVFESSGRAVKDEIARFTLVNLFALVLVWVISVGLARIVFPGIGFTWYSDDIAHLIGVVAPAVTSYVGHKHFSFSRI
ncbi:MAG: GtrA family protein [Pseudomonadota bacterium]